MLLFFFFQAEDGIRDADVTGVQTCALPICTISRLQLSPRRMRVSGRAGSGKTLLGQSLFRAAKQRGEKVLYLCYNRPLADGVARSLKAPTAAMTIDRLTDQLPLPRDDFDPSKEIGRAHV